jgi:hypothetical protein
MSFARKSEVDCRRSATDLLRKDDLARRGVNLMGGQTIDTRSPTGKLMITMLGAIAGQSHRGDQTIAAVSMGFNRLLTIIAYVSPANVLIRHRPRLVRGGISFRRLRAGLAG